MTQTLYTIHRIIINLLQIISLYSLKTRALCPLPQVVYPCICLNSNIICGGYNAFDIDTVFVDISRHLNASDKQFDYFLFNNTEIIELPENLFRDISFKHIQIIDALSLQTIHSNLFGDNEIALLNITSFEQTNSPHLQSLAPERDLFALINSFSNVESIKLSNNSLTEIPQNAFKYLPHLTAINLTTTALKKIGNNAFYEVDSLRVLDLSKQHIDKLDAHVFDFHGKNQMHLEINLEQNQLTGTSFEAGVFANAKRPLSINLSNNRLTYLDEKIFSPVIGLSNATAIDIRGNPLECDCQSKWMFANKDKLRTQILNAKCKTGRDIWDLTAVDFSKCAK